MDQEQTRRLGEAYGLARNRMSDFKSWGRNKALHESMAYDGTYIHKKTLTYQYERWLKGHVLPHPEKRDAAREG